MLYKLFIGNVGKAYVFYIHVAVYRTDFFLVRKNLFLGFVQNFEKPCRARFRARKLG